MCCTQGRRKPITFTISFTSTFTFWWWRCQLAITSELHDQAVEFELLEQLPFTTRLQAAKYTIRAYLSQARSFRLVKLGQADLRCYL